MSEKKNPLRVMVTRRRLPAEPLAVWQSLLFFEQIPGPPPFLLSLLLPAPVRVEGQRSRIGDETRCVYAGGSLVKRVTALLPGRLFAFDVVEQEIAIGGGIRLESGSYRLSPVGEGTCVELETRYRTPSFLHALRWPVEALVARAFHGYLLDVLGREVRALPSSPAPAEERSAAP